MKATLTLSFVFIFGLSWTGLWWTPDQQGQRMMNQNRYADAADSFRDPMREGVAWFRAKEFERAEQAFSRVATAEAEYNRGTCLIMLGKYDAAIGRLDRALELRPGWEDAEVNRSIALARAERTKQEGGDMGDQKLGADEIRFDKKKSNEGQDTDITDKTTVSDEAMQALWLRRVQTKPADFLRSKFAYQLDSPDDTGTDP